MFLTGILKGVAIGVIGIGIYYASALIYAKIQDRNYNTRIERVYEDKVEHKDDIDCFKFVDRLRTNAPDNPTNSDSGCSRQRDH